MKGQLFAKYTASVAATALIVAGVVYAAGATIAGVTTQTIASGSTISTNWFQQVNDHVNGGGILVTPISTATIQKFHDGCLNPWTQAIDAWATCSAGCKRYCSSSCYPGAQNCGNPIIPGLNYRSGFVNEWDIAGGAVECTCIK